MKGKSSMLKIYLSSAMSNIRPSDKYLLLQTDNWNDYGHVTTFKLRLIDKNNNSNTLIGMFNLAAVKDDEADNKVVMTNLFRDHPFSNLEDWKLQHSELTVISLGGLEYYENVVTLLSREEQVSLFSIMGDVAFNEDLLDRFKDYSVIKESFFRGKPESLVRTRLRRITQGGQIKKEFKFEVKLHGIGDTSYCLNFSNDVENVLPSNMYVITGSNGNGKTRLIKDIACSATDEDNWSNSHLLTGGKVHFVNEADEFKQVVLISTSPFDDLDDLNQLNELNYEITSLQVLKMTNEQAERKILFNLGNLQTNVFWQEIIEIFKFDASMNFIFQSVDFSKREHEDKEENVHRLSTGQKVILLTLSELLLSALEMTLYIIDEPEVYLHPPYVAAFAEAISRIATRNNSMALVVTHSPFFVQMVSEEKVYILMRENSITGKIRFVHPQIATFGRNVEAINREVFGVEVMNTGYFAFLRRLAVDQPEEAKELISKGILSPEAAFYLSDLLR